MLAKYAKKAKEDAAISHVEKFKEDTKSLKEASSIFHDVVLNMHENGITAGEQNKVRCFSI